MAARTRSAVWKYFVEDENNPAKAKCLLCPGNVSISRGSRPTNRGKGALTTSNMIHHLEGKHPVQYKESFTLKETCKRKADSAQSSSNVTSDTEMTECSQATVPQMLEKIRFWDINHPRAKEIHYRIGEMIAVDLQPFSFVDDEGFKRVAEAMQRKYTVPSRNYFAQTIIPDMHERVFKKVQGLLNDNVDYISCTTDIWTANVCGEPFLSLTGHWLTNDFERKTAVLKVLPFPGSHTAMHISDALANMLEIWDIPVQKVHVIVRDNAANMIAGINRSDFTGLSCFSHTLQLCILDAIFSQRVVSDVIAKSRSICTHFNHSAKYELQQSLSCKIHTLLQDVISRWNSTFYMLERISEQRRPLTIYTADHNLPTFTSNDWDILDKVIVLLRPFEEITRAICYEDACASMVIPTLAALQLTLRKMKNSEVTRGVQTMADHLYNSVNERFGEWKENPILVIATYLDPRYKTKFFQESTHYVTELVQKELEKTLLLMSTEVKVTNLPAESIGMEVTDFPSSDTATSKCKSILWESFEEIITSGRSSGGRDPEGESGVQSFAEKAEAEMHAYCSLPPVKLGESPFLWWNKNGAVIPGLRRLAKKYLSAPPTSVASERLFSTGGGLYQPKRNRLSPEHGEMLMFLHCNLKLLNFKY